MVAPQNTNQEKYNDICYLIASLLEKAKQQGREEAYEEVKRGSWLGWTCVSKEVPTVRYSPIFDTQKEATNYPNRPKGTVVVKVYGQSDAIINELSRPLPTEQKDHD